jgi:hypothetical protein
MKPVRKGELDRYVEAEPGTAKEELTTVGL